MTSKLKMSLKTTSKNVPPLQKFCAPPLKEYYLIFFLLTSQVGSHGTSDIKLEMFSGVQTGNEIQHVEHQIGGIVHVHTYRTDEIFMQRRLLLSVAHPPKKIKYIKKICPFRNCIQRMHYPFAAFFSILTVFESPLS